MAENFDQLLGEYDTKVKQLNQINTEVARLLESMHTILLRDQETASKLEAMMKKYTVVDSEVIDFNIGGTLFSILKSDLTKKIVKPFTNGHEFYGPNLFQGLLSGLVDVKYDRNKAIFINRDPKYFSHILNYLRMANTGETFIYPSNDEDLNGLLKEAEYYRIDGLKLQDSFSHFGDSLILNRKLSQELIRLCGFSADDKWILMYRGSLHGFGAKDFHAKCDNVDKTLTLIKTTQSFIFGGWTKVAWDSLSYWKLDEDAFIFSLVNKFHKPIRIDHDNTSGSYSICCGASHGPVFGGGSDIRVEDNANANSKSYSNFGSSFKHPQYVYGSVEAKTFLAGTYNFQITEIEIYRKL